MWRQKQCNVVFTPEYMLSVSNKTYDIFGKLVDEINEKQRRDIKNATKKQEK